MQPAARPDPRPLQPAAPTGDRALEPAPGRSPRAPALGAATSRRPSPLWQLTLARYREFVREPEALFWVFAFPLLLAVALGLAFRDKAPDRIPVGIVSGAGAQGAAMERAAATLAQSPVLLVRAMPEAAAREALRTGRISLLIEPAAPAGGAWTFRFDQTRPDARIARLEAADVLERAAGRTEPVPIRSQLVTERGSRYIDFLIPGLLGMNLMGTGVWSLAFGITAARQRLLLKRLIAAPMRRSHYLLSQVLGRLVFLLPEMALLIGIGWLAFGVAVRGSFLALVATSVVGAMSFCGLGLLIASRVRTIEGASGLANVTMMPMWLLSGIFFSADRFPDRVQPLIRALPLTALIDALRGIMNEGRGLTAVAGKVAITAAWGLGSYLLALRIFRWR